jgi:hypothetical protein
MAKSDLQARPIYHRRRDSIEADLTIVFAALAVSCRIEHQTSWPIRKFVKTTRRSAPSRSRPATASSPPPTHPRRPPRSPYQDQQNQARCALIRVGLNAEPAVELVQDVFDDRMQLVGVSGWLWPSRVRWPASLMTIWNTPASAIPCSLAISGATVVVSLMARAAAGRPVSSGASRCTVGLMAARDR